MKIILSLCLFFLCSCTSKISKEEKELQNFMKDNSDIWSATTLELPKDKKELNLIKPR